MEDADSFVANWNQLYLFQIPFSLKNSQFLAKYKWLCPWEKGPIGNLLAFSCFLKKEFDNAKPEEVKFLWLYSNYN